MKPFSWILVLLFVQNLLAQSPSRNITTQTTMWYGYYFTIDFGQKWRLVSEVQERHFVQPLAQQQWLLRSRLYRNLGHDWEAALGLVHFWNNPNDPCTSGNCLTVPEIRPYQEFQHRQTIGSGWSLRHRYMVEGRFFRNHTKETLLPGHFLLWRFRYMLTAEWDIFNMKKNGQHAQIRIAEEILVQSGKIVRYNFFDHNRNYIGLWLPFSKHWSAEVGYMLWFQQRNQPDQFYLRHIARVGLFHRVAG